jgi:hypothetical protein
LIHWLLTRLERLPSAVFHESELRARFPNDFDLLRRQGIITRLPLAPLVGTLARGPRNLTLVSIDDAVVGLDEEDEDPEVEEIPIEDVATWKVELNAICSQFRARNELSGPSGVLRERIIQLGETSPSSAVFLALLADEESSSGLLKAIPSLASQAYSEIFVICPSFQVQPSERRALESLGIKTGMMDKRDPLLLPIWSAAPTTIRAGGDESEPEFQHSPENRWVKLRGREWTLPPMANIVISLLAEAHRVGRPDMHWKQITSKLSGEPASIHDVFKRVPDAEELVVSRGKGVFRLNLPS